MMCYSDKCRVDLYALDNYDKRRKAYNQQFMIIKTTDKDYHSA